MSRTYARRYRLSIRSLRGTSIRPFSSVRKTYHHWFVRIHIQRVMYTGLSRDNMSRWGSLDDFMRSACIGLNQLTPDAGWGCSFLLAMHGASDAAIPHLFFREA
jgi:hypothetical protein